MVCAAPQNVGPCDGSGGRLETRCKIAVLTLFLCLYSDSLEPSAPLNFMGIISAHLSIKLMMPDMPMENLYPLRIIG